VVKRVDQQVQEMHQQVIADQRRAASHGVTFFRQELTHVLYTTATKATRICWAVAYPAVLRIAVLGDVDEATLVDRGLATRAGATGRYQSRAAARAERFRTPLMADV